MAASVLNSPRAIEVSIYLVRTFIAMRRLAENSTELAARIDELERKLEKRLAGQDRAIADIFAAIRSLMKSPEPKRRPIGFAPPEEDL
jgi:ATP-dependent Clp protease ATP-binding subunit ClpA